MHATVALNGRICPTDIVGINYRHLSFQREIQEKREKKTILQRKERERRQVTARARRYYDEFRLQAQSRMAKRKTKEEKVRTNVSIKFDI